LSDEDKSPLTSPPGSPTSTRGKRPRDEVEHVEPRERKKPGRSWNEEEILLFRKGIEEFGWSNWEKIRAKYFDDSNSRSADSLRSFAVKNLQDMKEDPTNLTPQLIAIMSDNASFSNKMAGLVDRNQK
jgi:hypothetical protein